mgnify:CR=1 FL=1
MSKPKRNLSIIGTAILLLLLVSVIFLLFLIFTFPRVSLSESKGFNKGDIFKLENGKLRFTGNYKDNKFIDYEVTFYD